MDRIVVPMDSHMDILWTGLWTDNGLYSGLDGLYCGLLMDYIMD